MNGKILIIFLFVINLFAVSAKVDKQNVIEGDNVAFSITASGGHIIFPDISSIGGNNIEAVSSSTNIIMVNGNYKRTLTKTYVFSPAHSLMIPSYKVIVDGKAEYTQPIKINVVKDIKTDKNFKLKVDTNTTAIVGFPNIVDIKFYQKTNEKVNSVSLELPKGAFELKQVGKEKISFEGAYRVVSVKYQLIPKKAGDIDFLVKLRLGFATQSIDPFGFVTSSMRYKTLQKDIKIKAKKIYDGLIGDFNISLNVDKTKVNANEPVNATLEINGNGDLSSLGDIKINIPNVTIYDNKAVIKDNRYIKKFVIVADKSYTIPPLSLSFYSLKDKKVKTIYTKEIKIDVKSNNMTPMVYNNTTAPKNTKLVKKVVEYKINYIYLIIVFVLGLIIGFLLSKIKINKKNLLPTNLYDKLLPYADNPKIKEILNKLYNKQKLSKEDKEFLKGFFNENKRSS